MPFIIEYQLEGDNRKRFIIIDAPDKSKASHIFWEEPPGPNPILLSIEDEQEKTTGSKKIRLMKKKSSFDDFLIKHFESKNIGNKDTYTRLRSNRNTWNRLRKDPGKFNARQIIKLAEILGVSEETILHEIKLAIKDS